MVIKSLIAICILSGQAYAASSWPQRAQSNPPHLPAKSPTNQSLDAIYAELASRRQLQINRLHAYAAQGQFPQNTNFPDLLVPYFVDHEGTACAVGHLMRLDGQGPLVNQIAANHNHIRIENVSLPTHRLDPPQRPHARRVRVNPASVRHDRRLSPRSRARDEQERLRNHFARVEKTLQVQSQRILGEALITKLEALPLDVVSCK